jgi:hypothetical protein
MPVPLPPANKPLLRSLIKRPWSPATRVSPGARKWCDSHGYITPHFTWVSYACSDGTKVPQNLHANAIKLHWRLEHMRHKIGDLPMSVDGPYRTRARNKAVGGAANSRHIHADAADFFVAQITNWVTHSPALNSRDDVLTLAEQAFSNGGVGNENSGTLHVDARGFKVRFITWTPTR